MRCVRRGSPQHGGGDGVLDRTTRLAQADTARRRHPLLRANASMRSWIFSYTRGTPKKMVGRQADSECRSEPRSASGRAK